MATRQEQIVSTLEVLARNLGADLTGTAAVGNDGIVLASRMASGANPDRVGAVSATMLGVTRRVSGELAIGGAEETIIKGEHGYFLVVPAGDQALLTVGLRQSANLGMVRIELRDAAEAIKQALDSRN